MFDLFLRRKKRVCQAALLEGNGRKKKTTHSILLLIPYFGLPLPDYFERYWITCKYNETIDFLFLRDADFDDRYLLPNVQRNKMSAREFIDLARAKLQLDIPYEVMPQNMGTKICDFRSMYGVIFEDLIKGYDFWGYTDLDVLYGNLRAFYTPDILDEYDIISNKIRGISGHHCLFRNAEKVNRLFRATDTYRDVLCNPSFTHYDERTFTELIVKYAEQAGVKPLFRQTVAPYGDYIWDRGKLYKSFTNGEEIYQSSRPRPKFPADKLADNTFCQFTQEFMYTHYFSDRKKFLRNFQVERDAQDEIVTIYALEEK